MAIKPTMSNSTVSEKKGYRQNCYPMGNIMITIDNHGIWRYSIFRQTHILMIFGEMEIAGQNQYYDMIGRGLIFCTRKKECDLLVQPILEPV
jgi:L-rhamnose mutarotase